MVREERPHLLLALHVRLLPGEAEPPGIVEVGRGPDRQQHVVRLGVLAAEVMRIVGGHDAETQLPAEAQHPLGHHPLVGDAVLLDLEPEAVLAEAAREPLRRGAGLVVAARAERQRDFSGEARGETDHPVGVAGQDLLVDPRPAVKSLTVSDRREPDQVPVPGAVPGEEDQVAVRRRRVGRLLLDAAVAEGEVRLEPEDRPELPGPGLVVKAPRRVEVAVVGDGEAVHAQALHLGHEVRNPVGPVEEGVFAVGVEMDERHAGGLHAPALRGGQRATQDRECAVWWRGSSAPSAESPAAPVSSVPCGEWPRRASPSRSSANEPHGSRKLPASFAIVKNRCPVLTCTAGRIPPKTRREPRCAVSPLWEACSQQAPPSAAPPPGRIPVLVRSPARASRARR